MLQFLYQLVWIFVSLLLDVSRLCAVGEMEQRAEFTSCITQKKHIYYLRESLKAFFSSLSYFRLLNTVLK